MVRVNAVINRVLSVRGIVDPTGMTLMFCGPEPNYPFTIRLWSGLVFMFGVMFWETSNDVRGKLPLMKYNWIEKTINAAAVTAGFFAGDVPIRLMILIIVTNWLWSPVLIGYEMRLRGSIHGPSDEVAGGRPSPAAAD